MCSSYNSPTFAHRLTVIHGLIVNSYTWAHLITFIYVLNSYTCGLTSDIPHIDLWGHLILIALLLVRHPYARIHSNGTDCVIHPCEISFSQTHLSCLSKIPNFLAESLTLEIQIIIWDGHVITVMVNSVPWQNLILFSPIYKYLSARSLLLKF